MDIFSFFFHMKVCCFFSLESPRRGDSNVYIQYTIFFSTIHLRLIFISLMNTKSNIFTRGCATHENTTFSVHSVK